MTDLAKRINSNSVKNVLSADSEASGDMQSTNKNSDEDCLNIFSLECQSLEGRVTFP